MFGEQIITIAEEER